MKENDLSIIILAAGKGTRMKSSLPKVLHEIAGKPILKKVIEAAKALSPTKIIVVYGYGGETVKAKLSEEPVEWVEQKEQLGTGHAVMQAMPLLGDSSQSLVLLGDVPLIESEMCTPLLKMANAGLAILSCSKENPAGYGRIVREGGRVKAIIEHKDASEEQHKINEVNTGIMAMPTEKLKQWLGEIDNNNAQQEYYLTDIVALAVSEGTDVDASMTTDEWAVAGVNSKLDLVTVERQFQQRQAEDLLSQGVTLFDHTRLDIRGELTVGQTVSIDVGCVFEGSVTIEDGVNIGPYCVIKNSTIGEGTTIAAYSHIENSEVGNGCRVGPYARLRPGTKLAANNHIGNFVEIKNAMIDDGSKVNHLSYVGDAEIGKQVNIGAGTITCNYDGANKFKTIVEDNAFIGSDTQLVAPVRVTEGSTIGAGSTITKDTKPNSLTICRANGQVTINGWKRPVKQKKAK